MADWLGDYWKWMVTTVVALAALCFTSHNWYLNWREKRKKARVTLGHFFLTTASGQRLGGGGLSLRISNRGAKCVLTGYHVQTMWSTKKYRLRGFASGGSPQFPHVLDQHADMEFHEEKGNLAVDLVADGLSGTVKIRGVVEGREGERFTSAWLRYNIEVGKADHEQQRQDNAKLLESLREHLKDVRVPQVPDLDFWTTPSARRGGRRARTDRDDD